MGIYSPVYIVGMMFGCMFTWVWFYLIFNWSWKLAIAFFCLALKDMVTASSDMLNMILGKIPVYKNQEENFEIAEEEE